MKKLALALGASALVFPLSAQAATIFGVTDFNDLVAFDSANPGTYLRSSPITGTSATFLAIDFRGSNGLLYGLGDDHRLYTIDTLTGVASGIGGDLMLQGTNFGFDFNEVVDMIRVVSNNDDNYVVNPDTGEVSQFTDVGYEGGTPNAIVTGNAYRHGTAMQFAVDTLNNQLVMQANNAGTLTVVGPLGRDVGPRASFDIGFDGVGYIHEIDGFHTVNLETGQATLIGRTPNALFGISAAPTTAAVPEPSTWGMMLLGFGAVGTLVRRRNRTRAKFAFS